MFWEAFGIIAFFGGMGALILAVFVRQDAVRAWEDRQIARLRKWARGLLCSVRTALTAAAAAIIAHLAKTTLRRLRLLRKDIIIQSAARRVVTRSRSHDAEAELLRVLREVQSR